MIVTIITDASVLQPGCEVWGWAAAIISDRGRKYIGDRGRAPVSSSNDAELFAIANALRVAVASAKPGDILLIQCDNLHAVSVLQYRLGQIRTCPKMTIAQRQAIIFIENTILTHSPQIKIHVKHIKAHLAFDQRNPRHHVHEKVDELAGQWSRQAYLEHQRGGLLRRPTSV